MYICLLCKCIILLLGKGMVVDKVDEHKMREEVRDGGEKRQRKLNLL